MNRQAIFFTVLAVGAIFCALLIVKDVSRNSSTGIIVEARVKMLLDPEYIKILRPRSGQNVISLWPTSEKNEEAMKTTQNPDEARFQKMQELYQKQATDRRNIFLQYAQPSFGLLYNLLVPEVWFLT